MNINLTEPEVKQAIQEYLNKRLVDEVSATDIVMTVSRAPQAISAAVDITFGSTIVMCDDPDVMPMKTAKADPPKPAPEKVAKKLVVTEPAPKVVKEPAPEPDMEKLLDEVKEEMTEVTGAKEVTVETPAVQGELDDFGAPVDAPTEEAPIVEGENTMTENFELKTSADNVAAPIIDDVEDLFNC